jgi:hypothetical protein
MHWDKNGQNNWRLLGGFVQVGLEVIGTPRVEWASPN